METKLLYVIAAFLGIALIIFAITSITNNEQINNDNLKNILKIQGESKINIMPNEGYIYFTIQSEDKNSVISKNNVDQTWQELKIKLDSEKIRYETINYSVQPNYVWNEKTMRSEIQGYITRHGLKITLIDLTKTSETIDKLVINNYTNIDTVEFGLSDSENAKLKTQLWTLAINDAQNTVKDIAKTNNIKINLNPISIEESGNYYRPYYSTASAYDSKSDIAPKEQTVNLTLTVTFELE